MGQALYRAHRPKKLDDVVGQEHVTTALSRAIKNGTISHAYLLTGPRGVGKTSIARILAHEINGLPYDDDSMHLDIIEIDAASNRRIDEIRDLRDKVHIAPTSAKFKVYIIDEVHMLTKEAFNALLKTLEEPPAHVVFILATTEVNKLPETIISRTQRYAFKPVDLPKVVAHLRAIADDEKIKVDDAALELIAAHGEGSFRDSISLLDQVRNSAEKVTLADVQATLGIAPQELIAQLLEALAAHDAPALAVALQAVHAGGHEPSQVAKQLGRALRAQLLSGKPMLATDVILPLLGKLLEVSSSSDPKSFLEIILLDAAFSGQAPAASVASASPAATPAPAAPKIMKEAVQAKPPVVTEPHPSTLRKAAPAPEPAPSTGAPAPTAEPAAAPAAHPEPAAAQPSPVQPATGGALDKSIWPKVLAAIKAKHNTLFSIVRATEPRFDAPGTVTLICAYPFHQKRLNEQRNKEVLGDIIQAVSGQNVRIVCEVGTPEAVIQAGPPPLPPADEQVFTAQPEPTAAPTKQTQTVQAISNIFGGAELLES
ncbi:MAG TPA: DNA polymerase III subunit gamma/tau [Candidatus Saccharimonadales bacterium]|nr:DNA polymerase III subunit gamma/tau [Candidatus Saccharimonadales bacterium]